MTAVSGNGIVNSQAVAKVRFGALLNCWMLIAFAAAIAGAAFYDYRIVQEFAGFRTICLVAGIAAGVGIAFCLGGAMHYIDLALHAELPARYSWPMRALLICKKRILLIAQLAGAGLALACLAAFAFDLDVPGPDYTILYRSGIPPAPSQVTVIGLLPD